MKIKQFSVSARNSTLRITVPVALAEVEEEVDTLCLERARASVLGCHCGNLLVVWAYCCHLEVQAAAAGACLMVVAAMNFD